MLALVSFLEDPLNCLLFKQMEFPGLLVRVQWLDLYDPCDPHLIQVTGNSMSIFSIEKSIYW